MATQKLAPTRLAASAWGVSVNQARNLYTVAVRSAIAYGSTAWHTPTGKDFTVKGITRELGPLQNQCIGGAYRATPVAQLETELGVPPLNLYLDRRAADFEYRYIKNSKGQLLYDGCARVTKIIVGARSLQRKLRRGCTLNTCATGAEGGVPQRRREWAVEWYGSSTTQQTFTSKWEAQWQYRSNRTEVQRIHTVPAQAPPDGGKGLLQYKGMLKYKASLLI